MKELYKEPFIEIIKFNTEDIISTSSGIENPSVDIVDPSEDD